MGFWTGMFSMMRILACVFMFTVGGISASHAKSIRALRHPPELMRAAVLGAVFGCIGGFWSLVDLIKCRNNGLRVRPYFHERDARPDMHHVTYVFIWVSMDLMLTVGFALAAVEQSKYLPRPLGECQNLAQLKPDGGNEKSYFDLLSEVLPSDGNLSAEGVCRDFVFTWMFNITMAVLSGLACLLASYCVVEYFFSPSTAAISYLHYWTRISQRRSARRYRSRRALDTEKAQLELAKKGCAQAAVDAELGRQKPVRVSSGEVYLVEMLGRYAIVTALAKSCHHVDFRSLMRVSRVVRAAALGAMGAEMVRRITCSSGSKAHCWSCGGQICKDCTVSRILHHSNEVSFHRNCKPHCVGCYRRNRSYYRLKLLYCNNQKDYWWWVPPLKLCSCDKQELGVVGFYDVSLCGLCGLEFDQLALLERRQRRRLVMDSDFDEAGNVVEGGWRCLECRKCMKREDAERVWWTCGRCGRDCGAEAEFHEQGFR